jgi:DNA-binding response OmpR family regulator
MATPRILIVDDDRTLLDLLRVHLASGGLKVEVAEDAAVALRSLVETPPDLILLDIELPYLNGFEILAAVKADPATSAIPVIVLTGREDPQSRAEAERLGADGFLIKPVQNRQLIDEIFSRLARRAAEKARAARPKPE